MNPQMTIAAARYVSQVTLTRPANTTAYTAGDVVGATAAAIEFPLAGPRNGVIAINDADLRVDLSAVTSGMGAYRLHLYNVTPPSALADNAAWDLPSGDRSAYLGYVDLTVPVDAGSSLFVQTNGAGRKIVKMGDSTSLFGYLQTIGAYSPTSAEVYSVRLTAEAA